MYYAEFQHYGVDVQWSEVAKLAALRKGLSYRLKNDLVIAATDPATVADLVTLCNHLNMRRHALQNESTCIPVATTSSHTATAAHPKPATSTASGTASTASGTASGPMDLSGSCPRLTAEERACHMAEGQCYRCGGVGCMARQCPVGTIGKPMQAAATKDVEAAEVLN